MNVRQTEQAVAEEVGDGTATAAAATLAPASQPADGMTKAGMMSSMMSAMSGMSKSDLVDFFNKSMTQFGPNADLGVPDGTAQKNMATVAVKSGVSEDVTEMFSGEELSEDFKNKISTLIESAVNARLNLELSVIQEEQEQIFDELVEEYKTELAEQADEYLSYAVQEWLADNKLEVENGIKLEVQESFMNGLLTLFKEHYVDLPDERYDLVGDLERKVQELQDTINDIQRKNMDLSSVNEELNRSIITRTAASDLTESDAVKFFDLVEGLSYSDLNNFKRKIEVVKETYFGGVKDSGIREGEEIMGVSMLGEEVEVEEHKLNGPMAVYAQAISRTIKR